ncbi:glycosyltransferase family 39 protein [Enterococcus thailandicus]|uniref:glycosyltransferase family 39 protein n=1 Tax=Enterococcus thailandicus TaxID=417368 RepID=UPI0022E3CF20|nr:glycosyltransferase family 39 protein [Enterococcus thailandicus]
MTILFKIENHKLWERKYSVFLTVFSFLIMLIFSKSSPLYFINDWVDANAFFSVGKGIAHGQVPYKDLFEQKGILLYFIHAMAYKLSATSFFGVYLLESISFAISMILLFKICNYYFSEKIAFAVTCLSPIILLNKDYFRAGDSAEEFAFPFVLGLLYLIISISNTDERIKGKQYFIQGLLMGCVFWIKYTMISPWIAFFLFFGIYYLVRKDYQQLLKAVICSLLGFLLVSIPIISYFLVNHALHEMYFVYFKFNMVLYPQLVDQGNNVNIVSRFFNTLKIFFTLMWPNKISLAVLMIGSVYLLFTKAIFKQTRFKVLWLFMFLCTNFFVFYGGIPLNYYLLFDLTILLVGFLGFCLLLKNLVIRYKLQRPEVSKFLLPGGIIFAILLMVISNDTFRDMRFFTNRPSIQIKNAANTNPNAKVPAQLEFAKYLKGKEDVTLLNYRFVDYGFSVIPNIVPSVKYFMNVNIPYEVYQESMDQQNKYVEEKKTDYVVAGLDLNDDVNNFGTPWLHENYHPIAVHVQEREENILKYVLYEKNKK